MISASSSSSSSASASAAAAAGALSLNERSFSFFVMVVTRLLATNPAAVLAVLAQFSDQARQNGLPVFIDNCLSKTDLIREVYRQKATALGLVQFLAPQHSDLLGHITSRTLDFVASVLLELCSSWSLFRFRISRDTGVGLLRRRN